ncbi:peptidylprolyl isomerase [Omnitrophica bacterium]|nr:peptidylprolyl isomerase [Candidatus Omnitrophota bacterium]
MRHINILLLMCTLCYFTFSPAQVRAKGDGMAIQKGSKVSFDYTLVINGQVFDSSEGKEPFSYTHGEGNIIRGLSRQLEGMSVGEEKQIMVKPQDAYGEIDPTAFKEISKSQLPKDVSLQVNMILEMRTQDDTMIPVRISEIKKEGIVIDLNHPLAGKTLLFQVKIVSIN